MNITDEFMWLERINGSICSEFERNFFWQRDYWKNDLV